MPAAKTHRAHCPSCRRLCPVNIVGKATIARQPVNLTLCLAPDCGLIWAVRAVAPSL